MDATTAETAPHASPRADRPTLPVDAWEPTRQTLHMWLQIVGKTRMINAVPLNHYWHVTLLLSSRGLTTGLVPAGSGSFEVEFDFHEHALHLRTSDARSRAIPLESMTVAEFYRRFTAAASELEIPADIHAAPNEVDPAIPFAEDVQHATYIPEHALAFWRQLVDAHTELQHHRATFAGKSSPVHFFWGALDLAVTRFSGRDAPVHPGGVPNCPDHVMTESYRAELCSAGFWPGGGKEGAYYAYAYPAPAGYRDARVPHGAFYDEDLAEFLLPYEVVRTAPDPHALVQDFLDATFQAAWQAGTGWRDGTGDEVEPLSGRS